MRIHLADERDIECCEDPVPRISAVFVGEMAQQASQGDNMQPRQPWSALPSYIEHSACREASVDCSYLYPNHLIPVMENEHGVFNTSRTIQWLLEPSTRSIGQSFLDGKFGGALVCIAERMMPFCL